MGDGAARHGNGLEAVELPPATIPLRPCEELLAGHAGLTKGCVHDGRSSTARQDGGFCRSAATSRLLQWPITTE